MHRSLLALTAIGALANAVDLIRDPGIYGPPIELVHLYYDEFPTGIAVSSTGRKFSNYPGGLDGNNTYRGGNTTKYTIAELVGNSTERPFPNTQINLPPGGAINYTNFPPTGANYRNYLIGSQSIVIDPADRAWILDTGRVQDVDGTLVPASYGGPKLIGVDLSNNSIIQTIVFPPTVAFADSYLNDVRFDLRANLSGTTGKGVAYITDSSTEGRNGIVIVDLGNGASWRHLDGNPAVHPLGQHLQFLWGQPVYANQPGKPFIHLNFGSDGIALSADGKTLFWKAVANRYLYSIPTARLRDQSSTSEIKAQQAIQNHGETGISDGLETDSNGFIYHGNSEQNAIGFFNPANGTDQILVRDPRINWVDTFATGTDGYLYFTNNQLLFSPLTYPGTDRRQKPYSLWRVKLPNNGTKPLLR